MRIGIDFGTTNSGAAFFDGRRVRVFPLDPTSRDPGVMRSALYITREQEVFLGQEAIDVYYRQNVGRPSRMVRQYVGEIEMTFAEIGTFVKDVYILVDELTPGRMLRSLKSGLATGYEGTSIFDRHYTLEEMIALYLGEIRRRVEVETGQAVEDVVLGRPVRFVGAADDTANQLAEERLRRAAELAGFRQVAFELEPVAAALYYELGLQEPQNVLVFDFGGGTLDITVMRVGEKDRGNGNGSGRGRVLATGGLDIAGDAFDRRIIEGLVLDHFGRGSTWGEDAAPFPGQYTDALLHWQTVPELNRPETLHFLRLAQLTGSHPARVRALESLVINNHAARLFDQVEQAKITLSSAHFALVRLAGEDIDLWQPVTRSQLEGLIADAARRIEASLLDTVARSGLGPEEIDAAVRTGGSAQIPCFVEMLGRIFGPQKVVLSDAFSSVTAGLAVRAALDAG